MIDTHCHLNLTPLSEMLLEVWQRAEETGISSAIVIGTDLKTSQSAIETAHKLERAFAAVGIHPEAITQDIKLDEPELKTWEEELTKLASSKKVVAIGECGLDYTELQELSDDQSIRLKNLQKRLFGMQVRLAKKMNLPLSIHCRNVRGAKDQPHHGLDAYSDIFDTLEHFSKDNGVLPKFVLHCMSGNLEYLERGLRGGGYISFAGNITYPSAGSLRELLRATPLDRLLLETDAPFLSPQSSRGTTNEPAKVSEIYEFVALELGLHRDQLALTIDMNAHNLFQKV